MPKRILSKKTVLEDMIETLKFEIFKLEIAKDYQESLETDEGKTQVNAAIHNIEENQKKLKFLNGLLIKEVS